jgi:hypothetical protein
METYKGKLGVIGARCAIVAQSEEAKTSTNAQSLAVEIVKIINNTKDLHVSTKKKNEEYLASKKETKRWVEQTVSCAANSLLMLESIKPAAEVNPQKLATKTTFKGLKIGALMEQTTIVGNLLTEKSSLLLAHGYKQEQIDELTTITRKLQQAIEKESAIGLELKLLRNKRNALTPSINSKYSDLNAIVMVNKNLMPMLYNNYFAVKVGKAKNSHMTIEGTITCNGIPLANASIMIYATTKKAKKKGSTKAAASSAAAAEKPIIVKFSNVNGQFSTQKLKAGTYKVIITKHGHITQELTLYVNPKEATIVTVSLDQLTISNN